MSSKLSDFNFAIVVSHYNETYSKKLLESCLIELRKHKVKNEDVEIFWVPGAFEIPLIAKKLALSGKYSAIICLGTIIRGATPHFDFVAGNCAKGIAEVSLRTGVPCIFGVVTANNEKQAKERTFPGQRLNRGKESAKAAVSLAELCRRIGV